MSRYDYKKRQIGEHYYGTRQGKKKSKVWRVFVFLLFFALIIALFIYVFPEVEVTIVPETETKVNDLNMTIDGKGKLIILILISHYSDCIKPIPYACKYWNIRTFKFWI